MKVDIERIYQLLDELDDINKRDLADLTFYRDSQRVDIDPKIIADYKYIGMNNVTFITSNYYRDHKPLT